MHTYIHKNKNTDILPVFIIKTGIMDVLQKIRITTERATSQPDKTLLLSPDVNSKFFGEILFSQLWSNYALKKQKNKIC